MPNPKPFWAYRPEAERALALHEAAPKRPDHNQPAGDPFPAEPLTTQENPRDRGKP